MTGKYHKTLANTKTNGSALPASRRKPPHPSTGGPDAALASILQNGLQRSTSLELRVCRQFQMGRNPDRHQVRPPPFFQPLEKPPRLFPTIGKTPIRLAASPPAPPPFGRCDFQSRRKSLVRSRSATGGGARRPRRGEPPKSRHGSPRPDNQGMSAHGTGSWVASDLACSASARLTNASWPKCFRPAMKMSCPARQVSSRRERLPSRHS